MSHQGIKMTDITLGTFGPLNRGFVRITHTHSKNFPVDISVLAILVCTL